MSLWYLVLLLVVSITLLPQYNNGELFYNCDNATGLLLRLSLSIAIVVDLMVIS